MSEERERLVAEAVERLRGTRRTFEEPVALGEVWAKGYEVTASGDPHFALAREARGAMQRHWRLAEHVLANDALVEALRAGTWNGRGLDARLTLLDEVSAGHHVFCPVDPRFVEVGDDAVELTEAERNVHLSDEERDALDALADELLRQWREGGGEPYTVTQISKVLGEVGWTGGERPEGWLHVRAWLLGRRDIARVGADFWVPRDAIPARPTRERLRVRPVVDVVEGSVEDGDAQARPPARVSNDEEFVVPGGDPTSGRVQWKVPLRTVHLLEGFVPVPSSAREHGLTPSGSDELAAAIRGRWIEDGDALWVWFDRVKNRMFGAALAEKLAWREAGEVLYIEWAPDVIVFRLEGVDDEVQREETRLVDLDELAELRGGLGESYRRSIQALLEDAPDGLTFRELVAAVRERQGHQVHTGTLRALLSAGGFVSKDRRWFASPDGARAARRLRSLVIQAAVASPEDATGPARVRAIRKRLGELIDVLEREKR